MEGSEGGQAHVLRLSILSQNIGRDELCECFKISKSHGKWELKENKSIAL